MSFLKNIEEKIENFTKQATEHSSLLNQKIQQIEQLTNDKSTIIALLQQLNGAVSALAQLKQEFSPQGTQVDAQPVVNSVEDTAKES